MSTLSLGDLAMHYQLRRDTHHVKTSLAALTASLSSGRKPDAEIYNGKTTGRLAELQRAIERAKSHTTMAQDAGLVASAQQTALGAIADGLRTVTPSLLQVVDGEQPLLVDKAAKLAEQAFVDTATLLNTAVGGRSVFAGVETDGPAVSPGDQMLDALQTATASLGTAADVVLAVDAWFQPGGGFDAAYLGSQIPMSAIPVAEGGSIDLNATADNPEIRDVLAALALGGLIARGVLGADPSEQSTLARISGERAVSADARLTDLRADIGLAESRIDKAATRALSEAEALEISRAELTDADPYDVASRLQEAQTQLEMMFTITARLSNLSLSGYLR